jgi:sterol desaturase/sphingolipid hydroxylase (fatty acid hydroxylase superfamily)
VVAQAGTVITTGLIDIRVFSNGHVLSEIGAAILYLFVYDFFYYWFHRAQHRCAVLWAAHSVHHSDDEYDSTTYLRQHVSEPLVQGLLVSVPVLILFRFTPVTIWVIAFLSSSWSFFTHMNIRLQLGCCSLLVAAPQLHRLHHSRLAQHADKNFAGYFPIWDILFGTYLAPIRNEFPPTGWTTGRRITNVASMVIWPFKAWILRRGGRPLDS